MNFIVVWSFFLKSVMDDRTFVLWRGQQRINFHEDDLTAERISAVLHWEWVWHLFKLSLRISFIISTWKSIWFIPTAAKMWSRWGWVWLIVAGSGSNVAEFYFSTTILKIKVLNKASLRSKRFRSSYCAKFGVRERFVNELARKRFLRRLK